MKDPVEEIQIDEARKEYNDLEEGDDGGDEGLLNKEHDGGAEAAAVEEDGEDP